MSEEQVVDAEVVEGQELVPVEGAALFRTNDPVEVIAKATEVADALKGVIDSRGLTTTIQGKQHVRVEGWQLLGSMLGVTAICVQTDPIDGGYKATVEARTGDGRVVGRADALCTKHEKRGPWKSADDYARLSMAQTRATSKALKGPLGFVVSLAGFATTPAEEMTFAEPDEAAQPKSGSNIPSENQLVLIDRRVKELGADDQTALMLVAYAEKNLTGGREGSASKVIGQLLVKDQAAAEQTLVEFVAAAAKWNATLADAPADTEGLPS